MGRIHPAADDVYFTNHPEERAVIRPFLNFFDVTHARRKHQGETEVVVAYLKPEQAIAEQLGLEREMLLVYSPYPQFQARTIKLHDEVYLGERTRLDPLGTIIVGDDPATAEKIQEYIATDQERAPIVAFSRATIESLHDATRLRDQLVRQLFTRDLFSVESPLTRDVLFFGRRDLVQELVDRFRNGQNSGLFGLRRIGKTSVLYAVRRRIEADGLGGAAYLDLSNPSLYKSRWWELLQTFARAFAEPLGLTGGKRSKIRAMTIAYSESDAARHYKADMQALAAYYPQDRLLLALDEIENITFGISPSAHWNDDFLPLFQTFRSVHQDLNGRTGFLLSGVNPRSMEAERIEKYDNPLFGTTKPFFLGPFDAATVREMVRRLARYMGLSCEEALYAALVEEYGGHPFLLRQACSQLAKQISERPGRLTTALLLQHKKHIALSLEKIVRQVLNVLAIWYPDEYELVADLARGERQSFLEFANLSAEFTQHMEGYGLVLDARTEPRITIGLVRGYLSRVPKRVSEEGAGGAGDPEEVLAEVSRRRNWIEPRLRRVLRDGLRYSKGQKAAAAVLAALQESRREVVAHFGYDDMWGELYFNELIAVVRAEWACFQNYFGETRDEVVRWLEEINKSRADAHARALAGEELAYLRICFARIEKKLASV